MYCLRHEPAGKEEPVKELQQALTSLNEALDEGVNPIDLVELHPLIVTTGIRLSGLGKSKDVKTGVRLLDEAKVWKAQFEARTHDATGFGQFLATLVNVHGLSLRAAGDLVGIPNASGVASRIKAATR